MATPADLQLILDEVLESKYRTEVRSRSNHHVIKNGGDEKYFNMSPNENFSGCMVNLTVSKTGQFRLGASISRIMDKKADIDKIMRDLTGNIPEYGTSIIEELRCDILRCTINSQDRRAAANVFTRFYDLTERYLLSCGESIT